MVAPIGADVDLFLEAHQVRIDSFFLDLRIVTGDQILTRHRLDQAPAQSGNNCCQSRPI